MSDQLIVFDMDGVLVDVQDSYYETIQQTVDHFTGFRVERTEIQHWKNQGGWNDDWALSHHLVGLHGGNAEYQAIFEHFNSLFHGDGTNGLLLRERWIAADGLFEDLAKRFQLAVFTGRLRWEAEATLSRCAPQLRFAPILGIDDVSRGKPAPEGLLKICARSKATKRWYVGDTVDDARAARDAAVPFIGIAAPGGPRYEELVTVLKREKAMAVLDNINQLPQVVNAS